MEETLDQFLAVLRFNHYYILDRLRQGRPDDDYQLLIQRIITRHEEELKDEYEVLCKAIVRTEREYLTTYQTQTNIRSGTVNIYSGNVSVRTFPMRLVDDVQPVALYHKAMPFEDIVTLAREKRTPNSKKYHHKLTDKVVETTNAETLTNPSPTPTPLSIFHTPIKKVGFDEKIGSGASVKPIQEAISKRLMLVSDSESAEHQLKVEEDKKEKKEGEDKEEEDDIIIIADKADKGEKEPKESLLIKKLRKSQQKRVWKGTRASHRTHQLTEKKTAPPDPNPPVTPSKKWQKNQQTSAREERRRREEEKLSNFMSGWISKRQGPK